MDLKFLIDACVARSVHRWAEEHFDAIYSQDVIPHASDDEILAKANAEGRVIITRDKDFGDMAFRDKKVHAGIILLRLQSKNPINQLLVLQKVLDLHRAELFNNFVSATDTTVKITKII